MDDSIGGRLRLLFGLNGAKRALGRTARYHIRTFGCQMNESDSERLAGALEAAGYESAGSAGEADVMVCNTCSVREGAENRAYGYIGSLKGLKAGRPGSAVIVCGCMGGLEGARARLKGSYPFVDLVVGPNGDAEVIGFLLRNLQGESAALGPSWEPMIGPKDGPGASGHAAEPIAEAVRDGGVKAWVSVMAGCDNFCSYCIVPYARGREASRDPKGVLDEVRGLAGKGCKEVTLLGQNVNSYGKAFGGAGPEGWRGRFARLGGDGPFRGGDPFSELIYRVADVGGIERVRFMTSHPRDLSEGLLRCYAECGKLCPHLHLPMQSGSTRVLREMNRGYTKEAFLETVARVRAARPGISVTTDVIVGFPGETEGDFEETMEAVRTAGFDFIFTFLYSDREGTPASVRTDKVGAHVAGRRFRELADLQGRMALERNAAFVGRTLEVLCEGRSKHDPRKWAGRAPDNRIVNFAASGRGPAELAGMAVGVRITEGRAWALDGELA
ncbi:MAG: tRNA (N6-isopentenyl adenosine(37)-C2)-methylthiotransferase MiaB [Oscillospiraceae bacterium]|nr:tRNA (N6-isopentenyl adenosine(37)-C2)-methylthiotransferase MiaB [Oscillospiraceae bacterium]